MIKTLTYLIALQDAAIVNRNIFSIQTSLNFKHNYSTDMAKLSNAFDDQYIISIAATNTSDRKCNVEAAQIASNWNIGLEAARKTIKCTTQKGIRNVTHPIERRFRTRQAQLRYSQLSGRHGKFYTDTFFASSQTLNGCKMAQLYINDLSFTKVYPMKTKAETSDTLSKFIHEVGIPHSLHSDDAPELMHGQFKQVCKEYNINTTYTEPYSPWQNRAEGGIRELKRHIYRKMTSKLVPQRLWDFCAKRVCEIRNKTAGNIAVLEERTPYEATLGNTPDISSLLPFDFYDPIWYYDETSSFPEPQRKPDDGSVRPKTLAKPCATGYSQKLASRLLEVPFSRYPRITSAYLKYRKLLKY